MKKHRLLSFVVICMGISMFCFAGEEDWKKLPWYGQIEEQISDSGVRFALFKGSFHGPLFQKDFQKIINDESLRTRLFADAISELVFAEAERREGSAESFLIDPQVKTLIAGAGTVAKVGDLFEKLASLGKRGRPKSNTHFTKGLELLESASDFQLTGEIIVRIYHGSRLADTAIEVLDELEKMIGAVSGVPMDTALKKAFAFVRQERLTPTGIIAGVTEEKSLDILNKFIGKAKGVLIAKITAAFGVKTATLWSFYLLPVAIGVDGWMEITRERKHLMRGMLQLTMGQILLVKRFSLNERNETALALEYWMELCRWKAFSNNFEAFDTGLVAMFAQAIVKNVRESKKEFARLRDESLERLNQLQPEELVNQGTIPSKGVPGSRGEEDSGSGKGKSTLTILFVNAVSLENTDIMQMDSDGTNLKKITDTPFFEHWPKISPDGKKIAFLRSLEMKKCRREVFVMDSDGKNVSQVSHVLESGAGDVYCLAWFPNNRRIAFAAGYSSSEDKIFSVALNGESQEILIDHPDDKDSDFDLSPDGGNILYRFDTGNWTPNSAFRLRNFRNGEEREIRKPDGFSDGWPRFSPDGTMIAWVFSHNVTQGGYGAPADIHIMPVNGAWEKKLTNATGNIYFDHPAWTPDGRILFTRAIYRSSGQSDIWIMNSNGSSQTRLTNFPGDESMPFMGYLKNP